MVLLWYQCSLPKRTIASSQSLSSVGQIILIVVEMCLVVYIQVVYIVVFMVDYSSIYGSAYSSLYISINIGVFSSKDSIAYIVE
jgi:hypothetical protein